MKVLRIVVCFLCVSFLEAGLTYKAGMYSGIENEQFVTMVHEAAKSDVDILVLPSLDSAVAGDKYNEVIKTLSTAAKDLKLYLIAHICEEARCQNNIETIRSSLVFDREGTLISVYRKAVSNPSNCTITSSDLVTFKTDFGVTFGLLMEEDIIIHKLEHMKGLKNFVISGDNDRMIFNAAQFYPSWSYINNANLVSSKGIYAGKAGFKTTRGKLAIANLDANVENVAENQVPVMDSADVSVEDLSQYSIKPLDLEASAHGYKETVCYQTLCCEFDIKTGFTDQNADVSYKLAAFDGVQQLTSQHNIGVQSCMLCACADSKKSCEIGPNHTTNVVFERISITANYTKQSSLYPIIHSTSMLPTETFKFTTKSYGISTLATTEIVDTRNLFKFGIFGREYSRDFQSFNSNNSGNTHDIYDLIYNEDVQEWFDYVWIRLRILLVVVSLYVLEMM